MRHGQTILLGVVPGLVLFGAGLPFAQPPVGAPPGRMFDPATVVTVRGEVTAVNTVPRPGRDAGVHLQLKTASGPLAVRLGPAWYIEREKLALSVRDELQITGSRVTIAGEPTLIAAEVKKGDRIVKLRDEGGLPLWRGRGGPPR